MRPQGRFTTCAANSATLRAGCVILGPMPRWSAFLVGIVAAAAFVALYQLVAWWTGYVLLGLWLAATILYRRRQRRRGL